MRCDSKADKMHHAVGSDSEIIEAIYAALLGEADWQAFLDRLTEMAPGCWSVLHANDVMNGEATVGLLSGRSETDVAAYAPYYHDLNPWARYWQTAPGDEAVIAERNVSGDVLERSEFYAGFLRPIDTRSSIGIGVESEGGRSLHISLMTPGAKEEDLLPLAWRITRIAPHLKRASEFYRRTSFAAHSTELGATLFDALHLGVVIVGAGRRIRTCSDMARRLFGPDVGLDPLGRLRLSCPVAQSALNVMLGLTYDGPRHRRMVVGRMRLTMIRMQAEHDRSLFEGPGVCMTIEPLGSHGGVFDLDGFSAGYRLTQSEVRVLSGLVAGKTLATIARENGRARETIRSQLKSLCTKTGARGQADLLRMVAGMKM